MCQGLSVDYVFASLYTPNCKTAQLALLISIASPLIWSKIVCLWVVSLLIGHFSHFDYPPNTLFQRCRLNNLPSPQYTYTQFWLLKSSSESEFPGPCLLRWQMQVLLMVACICCFQWGCPTKDNLSSNMIEFKLSDFFNGFLHPPLGYLALWHLS